MPRACASAGPFGASSAALGEPFRDRDCCFAELDARLALAASQELVYARAVDQDAALDLPRALRLVKRGDRFFTNDFKAHVLAEAALAATRAANPRV